jgi:hypothetical protein
MQLNVAGFSEPYSMYGNPITGLSSLTSGAAGSPGFIIANTNGDITVSSGAGADVVLQPGAGGAVRVEGGAISLGSDAIEAPVTLTPAACGGFYTVPTWVNPGAVTLPPAYQCIGLGAFTFYVTAANAAQLQILSAPAAGGFAGDVLDGIVQQPCTVTAQGPPVTISAGLTHFLGARPGAATVPISVAAVNIVLRMWADPQSTDAGGAWLFTCQEPTAGSINFA